VQVTRALGLSLPTASRMVQAHQTAISSGRSTRMPRSNRAPARTSATRWGAITARQRAWADSTSLKTIARAAAALPAPLVTFVRSRTVANVDSIGFVVRR
jgi:hypothetical protein